MRLPWLSPIRNSFEELRPLPSLVLRTEDMWQRYNQLSPVFPIIMSCLRSPSTTKPLVTH